MATVKGDVHDIGKNIVGVVLQCNNFEVIDLGVMVPCERILETARREGADMIGLSGLITPSLDEMVHVAREMQRQGFEQPLLIGGATTSPAHTVGEDRSAVQGPGRVREGRVALGRHLPAARDRRRSARSSSRRSRPTTPMRREQHHGKKIKSPQLTIAQARANRFNGGWDAYVPPVPRFLGLRVFDDYSLEDLTRYIDWMPFFNAWEFGGKFPDILTDPVVGEQASNLYADARRMLKQVIRERWLTARGVIGLFPANSVDDDDVEVYADESRTRVLDAAAFPAPAEGQAGGPVARRAGRLHRAEELRPHATTSAPSP